ncbi:hypothetical protein ACS0TY_015349 [Phlomoides rotata]
MFGAVIVNGLWGNERIECSVVNVNTTCPLNESEALWDIIHSVIVQNALSCCCIAGDFNSVRRESERDGRRGGSSRRRDINVFDDFFRNSGLIDLPLQERSYMWYKPGGSCWSRDRLRDWGPKPFKFFNSWLSYPDIKEFVIEKWGSYKVEGWGGFIIKEKLKRLKADIR